KPDAGLSAGKAMTYARLTNPAGNPLLAPDAVAKMGRPRPQEVGAGKTPEVTLELGNPHYTTFLDSGAQAPRSVEAKTASCTPCISSRGRSRELKTTLHLHPRANTIVYQNPMPARAAVAVKVNDKTNALFNPSHGDIAFVMDYSGSMLDPADPKNP